MAIDLDQFRIGYLTESLELLSDMETQLLGLDANASDNSEALNAIFRCAHSIKGGAGAFGLTQIAGFTHVLEAYLDKLRNHELTVTAAGVDVLLRARDVVLSMVSAAQQNQELVADFGGDILAQLNALCSGAAPVKAETPQPVTEAATKEHQRFTIQFTPHQALLQNGNEPLLLLNELQRLGKATITPDTSKIPPLSKLDPEVCYLSWTIELETDKGEAAIREVFEFVDTECDLSITLNANAPETAAASTVIETKTESAVVIPLAAQNTAAQAQAQPTAAQQPATTSIRVDIDKVDRLINMVGEIVIVQAMLAMQSRNLHHQEHLDLMRGVEELTQHTRELQEAVMAIRMQAVKSIFSRMPRLVRDLAGKLNKKINLHISGEGTEVDKTIIEQLSDPLTHMIRNSVDHGVESPEKRLAAGKPETGTIHLSAMHRGGKIVIEISDDGAGINRERVLQKAKEKGVVAPNAVLTNAEIDHLIFAPGFSTAEQVTDVSGRGVGMDVVRRNIESIGGHVLVDNRPGQGATFSISLPLTLAILDGMIVRVATEQYIVPIGNIIETMRPRAGDVKRVAGGADVLNVRGEFVPILYLHELFGIQGAVKDASQALVVLVEAGTQQLGLVVDELVGQQQVVIKSLEENADPINGISGATILGDGRVSLILDITGLAKSRPQPLNNAA